MFNKAGPVRLKLPCKLVVLYCTLFYLRDWDCSALLVIACPLLGSHSKGFEIMTVSAVVLIQSSFMRSDRDTFTA